MLVYLIFAVVSVVSGEYAPECGIIPAGRTQLPWQAGVYKNLKGPPSAIEWWGHATLVSNKAVITAGHKVYQYLNTARPAPPSAYSVAVGEQPWPWREPVDVTTQSSQVASIHLAPGFRYSGSGAGVESFGDDIAVLIAVKAFILSENIRPVCLNFDYDFDRKNIPDGALGKASIWAEADWNIANKDYFLLTAEMSQVPLKDCLSDDLTDKLDGYSIKILTLTVSDKVCFEANTNTTAPCTSDDEGAGISYPAKTDGVVRHYLWAIFSTSLNEDDDCTDDTYYLFTPILRFEGFLKKLIFPPEDVSARNKCVIPPFPYPAHGSYTTNVTHEVNITGGSHYELETLAVTCEPGYGVLGPSVVSCYNGYWLQGFPKCVRMCILKPHPSVTYTCSGSADGLCGATQPPGTLVSPRCNAPNYRSATPLPLMSCSEDGYWNYVARCVPDCGKVTPKGTGLVYGGAPAQRGELPWHVGVYRKTYRPYQQVCGGSLISTTLVISAAHCFWNDLEKQLPADQFAVAVGKLYRAWDDPADDAQKSDVKEIHLPPRFQGSASNYQDDIAVVEVAASFQYRPHVRPVCLSFDSAFESVQLQPNKLGKVAGWGLTAENGSPSALLQVVELPYVDVGTCIVESPPSFREYITSDKICAGFGKQAALCKGDSGGGLSFPAQESGTERHYLRGVVSAAPNNEHACNVASFTSFTALASHQHLIKEFLTDE